MILSEHEVSRGQNAAGNDSLYELIGRPVLMVQYVVKNQSGDHENNIPVPDKVVPMTVESKIPAAPMNNWTDLAIWIVLVLCSADLAGMTAHHAIVKHLLSFVR